MDRRGQTERDGFAAATITVELIRASPWGLERSIDGWGSEAKGGKRR